MSTKKKLSVSVPKSAQNDDALDKFIGGADERTKPANSDAGQGSAQPWALEEEGKDIFVSINIRMRDSYLRKLKYISEETGIPQQKLARTIVCPGIDEMLERMESGERIKVSF